MASCHATKLSPAPCGGGTILHPVLQQLWTLVWPSGKAFFGGKIEWSRAGCCSADLQEMHEYRSGVSAGSRLADDGSKLGLHWTEFTKLGE